MPEVALAVQSKPRPPVPSSDLILRVTWLRRATQERGVGKFRREGVRAAGPRFQTRQRSQSTSYRRWGAQVKHPEEGTLSQLLRFQQWDRAGSQSQAKHHQAEGHLSFPQGVSYKDWAKGPV